MDIVVYIRGGENEELRYAIRSWCQNLQFNQLVVVGGPKPKWLNPDIYIENRPTLRLMYQCHKNLVTALSDNRVSNDVLILMDDVFVLKNFGEWKINFNRGLLKDHIDTNFKNFGNNTYLVQLRHTYNYIGKNKVLSFEEHMPFLCDKQKMLKTLDSIPYDKIDFVLFKTLYASQNKIKSEYMADIKYFSPTSKLDKSKLIVSTNEEAFNGNIGHELRAIFTTPSKYEI